MTNKQVQRCTISTLTRKICIKITTKFTIHKNQNHFPSIRVAINTKADSNKYSWGCRESKTFVYCWWDCKMVHPDALEKSLAVYQNVKNRFPMWLSNSNPRHLSKRNKNMWQQIDLYTNVHSRIIHNGKNVEATQMSIS